MREIQVGNLTCGFYEDATGQLWMSTGRHGMVLKMGWDGKVQGWFGKHGDVQRQPTMSAKAITWRCPRTRRSSMSDSVLAKVLKLEHD